MRWGRPGRQALSSARNSLEAKEPQNMSSQCQRITSRSLRLVVVDDTLLVTLVSATVEEILQLPQRRTKVHGRRGHGPEIPNK